eukprot:g50911.t1
MVVRPARLGAKPHQNMKALLTWFILALTMSAAGADADDAALNNLSLEKMNFYELLELDRNAKAKDIKRQYRKLALKFHPDKALEEEKAIYEARFIRIASAYEVLSTPTTKARYDYLLEKEGTLDYNARRDWSEIDSKIGMNAPKVVFAERVKDPLQAAREAFEEEQARQKDEDFWAIVLSAICATLVAVVPSVYALKRRFAKEAELEAEKEGARDKAAVAEAKERKRLQARQIEREKQKTLLERNKKLQAARKQEDDAEEEEDGEDFFQDNVQEDGKDDEGDIGLECEVCNKNFDTIEQAKAHKGSSAHRKVVKRIEKEKQAQARKAAAAKKEKEEEEDDEEDEGEEEEGETFAEKRRRKREEAKKQMEENKSVAKQKAALAAEREKQRQQEREEELARQKELRERNKQLQAAKKAEDVEDEEEEEEEDADKGDEGKSKSEANADKSGGEGSGGGGKKSSQQFFCELCRKKFKSAGQMENHEASNAHKKEVKRLEREQAKAQKKAGEDEKKCVDG